MTGRITFTVTYKRKNIERTGMGKHGESRAYRRTGKKSGGKKSVRASKGADPVGLPFLIDHAERSLLRKEKALRKKT